MYGDTAYVFFPFKVGRVEKSFFEIEGEFLKEGGKSSELEKWKSLHLIAC